MSEREALAFLAQGARTGKLATATAGGEPHVVPVWFVLDGRDLVFTTWHETRKAGHLRRNPRAALCVDDERPPFSFAEAGGPVSIQEAPAGLLEWATRIATRYMGAEQGVVYGRRNAVSGEWLVRLRIEHLDGVAGVAR